MNLHIKTLLITTWRLFGFVALCHQGTLHAQDNTQASVKEALQSLNAFTERNDFEKLYIHTDKPSYVLGDTLWLKAYLLNASYLTPSLKSGIMYLEIASDSNKVVKRVSLPVYRGLASGQIPLNEQEFGQGGFILRGYTNWMRNARDYYVFEKPFYLANAKAKDWVVNYSAAISKDEGKDKMRLQLRLSEVNKTPVSMRELQIRLYDDKRTWGQTNTGTGLDGLLNLELDVSDKLNGKTATLSLQDKRKGEDQRLLAMPFSVNRPEKMDLQFMPEGGQLVAGLPARIAFKAIHEDGLGARVSGKVYNSKLQEVARFESTHKGMGSFLLTPQIGESYSARVNLPYGGYVSYALPAVKLSGSSLSIENRFNADSCEVTINATPDIKNMEQTILLVAHARGVAVYGASFNTKKLPQKIKIPKALFPTGVARFTLANKEMKALNERIVFIDHAETLTVKTTLNKPAYVLRDSVALEIEVIDEVGSPVKGNFSIAVTDDNQVKTDSLADYSITNQLLLAADLKGRIEEPGYYENPSRNVVVWQNLDHLLLSQGWTGFTFEEAFKPEKAPAYPAEQEFLVKGRVLNALNKPVAGSPLTLLSVKPALFMETVTGDDGRFTFEGLFPADTAAFHIQARNKKSKSFNVGIEMEEFVPPVFEPFPLRISPWYVNIDSTDLKRLDKRISLQAFRDKMNGNLLKEVVVSAKKIVKNSSNLNGPGEADFTVTRKELEKAGRTTLGELLKQKVPGFRDSGNDYSIQDRRMHLIIDGIHIKQSMFDDDSFYLHTKKYLDYYDAEEIEGIEVLTRKSAPYANIYLSPMESPFLHMFLEVTTIGLKGPFLHKMIGTYLYRPITFTTPKQFYSPKYHATTIPDMTDIRSTVYWNPNVVTNNEGIATVNFYTADTPGSYSIIIEGTDLNGAFGIARRKIIVRQSDLNSIKR